MRRSGLGLWMLDRWISESASLSQDELLRARFTAVTVIAALIGFGVEATVQISRGQLALASIAVAAAGALLVLGILLRLLAAQTLIAHGTVAVLVAYALTKILGSGGDSRAFYVLIFVPLAAVPTCGLRAGAVWAALAALGSVASGLFPSLGWEPPFRVDTQLRSGDAFWVGGALVLTSLFVAGWYEVLHRRYVVALRTARQDTLIARAELDDSQERFRALLEHGFEGAAIVDAEGRLKYLRQAAEGAVLGYRRHDFEGQSLAEMVREILHPEDLERALAAFRDVLAVPGKLVVEVVRLRARDGSYRTLEAAAHNLTREPAVRGLVLNYRDITDREPREGERARPAPVLPSAASLESLRLFAGGIAHEFNNMLTVILGQAAQLAERLPEGGAERGTVREIEDAGWRLAALTRNVLIYSGRGNPTLEPSDLGRITAAVFERAQGALPRAVELVLHRPHRKIAVRADAELLSRALRALLENAAEAMPAGGLATLRVGTLEASRELLERCVPVGDPLEPGRLAFVSISDEGRGIPPDHLPRVFDPYFSTHFSGRGLGLTLVLGVARAHGAALRVESEPDMGTTVTLMLPLIQP